MSIQNVVLGQLIRHRGYGWEVRERLRAFGDAFAISESAVYMALSKLSDRGLIVEVGREASEGPAGWKATQRRIFEATPAGHEFFERWMTTTARKSPLREELHMQLIVAEESDIPALLRSLDEFEGSCRTQLARIFACPLDTTSSANVRVSPWGARSVQRSLVGHLQASIEWAQNERLALERRLAKSTGVSSEPQT